MILNISNLNKTFHQGDKTIEVLANLNLSLERGDTLAILGPSGSGKTTLLTLIAGLDKPTSGSIKINDQEITSLSESALTRFRANHISIIFQQYHLLPHLTALENVSLPLELRGDHEAIAKARAALEQVGLGHRLNHYPHQLSGGENQRVAFARAFVVEPTLLLADEPSGSLDTKTGDQVMNLLFELVKRKQSTLVLVTHNEDLAKMCKKQFRFDK